MAITVGKAMHPILPISPNIQPPEDPPILAASSPNMALLLKMLAKPRKTQWFC